jgi:mRNA-degrading endonuclease YafQ of YafQ-DinJ toxin-antitoxin module
MSEEENKKDLLRRLKNIAKSRTLAKSAPFQASFRDHRVNGTVRRDKEKSLLPIADFPELIRQRPKVRLCELR